MSGRTFAIGSAVALLLAAALLIVVALGGSGGGDAGASTSTGARTTGTTPAVAAMPAISARLPGRFDGAAAMRLVRQQVAFGQRPAGSTALRRTAELLRRRMPAGARFEAIPGEPRLRNVVATVAGKRPGIVIGAHYDTLVKPKGFLGANNGAAGSAIVVELARELARVKRPASAPELRFVLFDGEEPDAGLPEEQPDFYAVGLRGSRAYVERHPRRTKEMVLLDYVGNKNLRLPREASSDRALWARVRAAAARVGAASVFPDEAGTLITDDHTPFLRAGVPAVDLIDWDYPGHDCCDEVANLSTASLDAVGETILELLAPRR